MQIGKHEEKGDRGSNPYSLFLYAIRSAITRDYYLRRLRIFFNHINILPDGTLEERCNQFASKGLEDPTWAFHSIIRFMQFHRERVEREEITSATLRNYVKAIKLFCEMCDIPIAWKKINRGLPKTRRFADDRAPTLEDIQRICEYPDRRIKGIVSTMASSGIRLGAWDYLRWGHIKPVKKDGGIVAAKLVIYHGDDDEYFSFITPEAYYHLKRWIAYRQDCGEKINEDSWVMRQLWNTKLGHYHHGMIKAPERLKSLGVKRLIEDALWTQGIRKKSDLKRNRYEFQTDHGLRKWFKTRCEIAGMKSINIEKLMGHSIGIADSYYRATVDELLVDYLKAIPLLTIGTEKRLQMRLEEVLEQSKDNDAYIKSQLYEKEQMIAVLTHGNSSNTDAIAALSDQVIKLVKEIEKLKQENAGLDFTATG